MVRDRAPDEPETEFRENRIPCTIAEKTVKANQSGHYVKKNQSGVFPPIAPCVFSVLKTDDLQKLKSIKGSSKASHNTSV